MATVKVLETLRTLLRTRGTCKPDISKERYEVLSNFLHAKETTTNNRLGTREYTSSSAHTDMETERERASKGG